MKRMEPPSSEGYASAFGEWKIWFEWGSARFDAPGEGIPPAWFVRRGTGPTESVPALDLTEEEFRRRLGELFDESIVEAARTTSSPASPTQRSGRYSPRGRAGSGSARRNRPASCRRARRTSGAGAARDPRADGCRPGRADRSFARAGRRSVAGHPTDRP